MHYRFLPVLSLILIALGSRGPADAHCEVPCGIYGDQQRFESMLEDQATILKAMQQVGELAGKTDAQSCNQLARWVVTKENHATMTQTIIAQYFMTQRIKMEDPKYVAKLTSAHAVMVTAMKCKQTVDTKVADALKEAILTFHKAYEAK